MFYLHKIAVKRDKNHMVSQMAGAKNSAELCMAHVENLYNIPCLTIPTYILSKNLAEKLLPSIFCDQTLYITNVCRVISRITKVTLLNNFLTECVLSAHGRIVSDDFHVPAILMESNSKRS